MASLLRNLQPTSLLTSLLLSSSLVMATAAIALPPAEVTEEVTEEAAPENEAEATGQTENSEEATPETQEKETEPAPQENEIEEAAPDEETDTTAPKAKEPQPEPASPEAETDIVAPNPARTSPPESAAKDAAEADPAIAPVAFPEAGITLIPPVDFAPAELFDGFQQEASQSSIMVLSFPAPTEEMLQAFGDEASLAEKGMTLLSQEEISISGQPGLLIQIEQEAHGLTFGKWILIFGEDNQTTLINASFPQDLAAELSAPIKASLLSAQVDDSLAAPSPEEASDFSITPTEGMALALEISGTLLYSEGGELNGEDPAAPLFIVSPSFSDVLALDQGKFSRDRLQQTEQVEAIEIVSEAPITIDDLEGYEITATAQDLKTATPLLLYQTILFAEDRYYILQGFVSEQDGGPSLADFKTMAESFQRK